MPFDGTIHSCVGAKEHRSSLTPGSDIDVLEERFGKLVDDCLRLDLIKPEEVDQIR